MIIEYHVIQNLVPANLNRDDTGAPKRCVFGGYPRARVSSQSWKRAMRMHFRENVPDVALGTRTKRAIQAIVDLQRQADSALDVDTATQRAMALLTSKPLELGLAQRAADEESGDETEILTKQLLFFRDRDLAELAAIAAEFGSELDEIEVSVGKKSKPKALPKAAADRVSRVMTSPDGAIDVALFGRMLAEMPEAGVDASCQVAHAIGTNSLSDDYDFYTAVDDKRPEETEGADMLGTVEFNSSCLYRYAALDVAQLEANLGAASDRDHVDLAVDAFTRAFVEAMPSGKQNAFAAHNPPSLVLVTKRERGTWNLANAFVKPVSGKREGLIEESARALAKQFRTLDSMFGGGSAGVEAGRVLYVEDDSGGLLEFGSMVEAAGRLNDLAEWAAGR